MQPSDKTGPRAANAVALAYREGDSAPQLIAKGRGITAEEIIRRAKEAGIHIHESRELVQLLMQVDLDGYIPPELYRAVAELLAWLYRIEQRMGASQYANKSGANVHPASST